MARGCGATIALLISCYGPAANHESCTIACTTACPPGYTCEHGRCRANDSAPSCDDAVADAPPGGEPIVGDDAGLDAGPNACPPAYTTTITATSTRYRLVTTPATWTTAAANCADDLAGAPFQTHLAVLTSSTELSQVNATNLNAAVWIGLTDRITDGAFQWVTAEPTTFPPATGTPWNTGEPNQAAEHDCVEMKLADLSALPCTELRPYFCECDAFANDPGRY